MLDDKEHILLQENAGIQTSEVVSYTFAVQAGKPLRVTLAWTDYPAAPEALKALVNDLDLEVIAPDGKVVRGNASADLPQMPVSCRDWRLRSLQQRRERGHRGASGGAVYAACAWRGGSVWAAAVCAAWRGLRRPPPGRHPMSQPPRACF